MQAVNESHMNVCMLVRNTPPQVYMARHSMVLRMCGMAWHGMIYMQLRVQLQDPPLATERQS